MTADDATERPADSCCDSDSCGESVDGSAVAGRPSEAAETVSLSVPSMDCASCANKVESSVSKLDVSEIDPRPTSGTLIVGYDPDDATPDAIRDRVEAAGYEIEDDDEPHDPTAVWKSSRAIRTGLGAVLMLIGITFEWLVPGANVTLGTVLGAELGVDWVAYVAAAAVAGAEIVRNGYYSIRNWSLDIDLLMTGGIIGALAVNLPFEAATLAVLFSIAELLERYSMDRARGSLRELMELSPETATVVKNDEEQVVPAEEVAVGDRVVVRPGEKVPVDGIIREGDSALDESPITGESVPADKGPGDEVYAGSLTEAGYLEIESTAPADESTIARVIELVEAAEGKQTDTEQFVDRFAAVYTPIIVVAALATMAIPPLIFGGPFTQWFVRGLTLLVVACPCAFVISTPVSVVSGLTSAARNGVLIKGGTHLEAMGEVEAVAVDKTGTLTTGDLGVTDVISLNGNSESDVLACAGALERRSEHPIADAVVDYADQQLSEREGRSVTNFEAITGEGVRAELDGAAHYAGKPGLFADLGFDLEHAHLESDGGVAAGVAVDEADSLQEELEACEHGNYLDLISETIPRLQREGKTVVLVGTEDELEGVIAIADTVRPESAWAVERLKKAGIERVVMLTATTSGPPTRSANRSASTKYARTSCPKRRSTQSENSGRPTRAAWRWSATASTTPQRWRPPPWESPWVQPGPTPPSKRRTSR